MKYAHPTIQIETPAPGHYVITGHNPAPAFVEGMGHLCASGVCHVVPEIPSEALFAILEDRGAFPPLLKMDPETGLLSVVEADNTELEEAGIRLDVVQQVLQGQSMFSKDDLKVVEGCKTFEAASHVMNEYNDLRRKFAELKKEKASDDSGPSDESTKAKAKGGSK